MGDSKAADIVVHMTRKHADALYAAVSRDLMRDELATLIDLAQKVADVDPRARSDSRSWAYTDVGRG